MGGANGQLELTIRPMKPEERLYCYTQSNQIMAQTGCIGHLRADMGSDGRHFYSDWDDHIGSLKTDQFKAELDAVVNALRFDGKYGGMLKDRRSLAAFCMGRPEGAFDPDRYDYGYRVDTEKYAYMLRLDPNPGLYNVYCYCYVREWLNRHMERAKQGIRFITSAYKELFRIPDGGEIRSQLPDGRHLDEVCRYIDETHLEVGRHLYHICEFAELMERAGITVMPLEGR